MRNAIGSKQLLELSATAKDGWQSQTYHDILTRIFQASEACRVYL